MSCFDGIAILCFYSNGLFQGHCIDPINNDSPYRLVGKLIDHVDPDHNDCMDPDDFYNVFIYPNGKEQDIISLLLRRPKDNDAGGLSSHEHEQQVNNGYQFLFETNQFLSGQEAMDLKNKYFVNNNTNGSVNDNQDLLVCIGNMKFDDNNNKD